MTKFKNTVFDQLSSFSSSMYRWYYAFGHLILYDRRTKKLKLNGNFGSSSSLGIRK